jgi:hypothetical protein
MPTPENIPASPLELGAIPASPLEFGIPTSPLEAQTTLGGVAQSVGAGLLAGATFVPQTLVSGVEIIEDITGLNLGGEEMDRVVDEAVEFWRKRIGKSKAEQIIGQASETIGALATTAAVGGAAGILAGAGVTTAASAKAGIDASLLLSMSVGAGLERTAEELEIGTPRLNAYGAGFVQAGVEYLTEKIPIGALQKPGLSFLQRLGRGAIADIPGELIATATEMKVIEERILGREARPVEEFVQALKDTAMVSALSTVGLTGGSHLAGIVAPRPDHEVPDTELSVALNAIKPLETPRPPIQAEKVEVDPLLIAERDGTKADFPELASQTIAVNPEEQFSQTIATDVTAPIDETPTQDVYQTAPYVDNAYAQSLERSRSKSKDKRKISSTRIWEAFVRNFVDVSGNVKAKIAKLGNDGLRVVAHKDAQSGAVPKAHKVLNIISKPIYSGMNSNERLLFDGYISGLRDLELKKRFGVNYTLRDNVTEQQVRDYIDAIPDKYMVNPDGTEGQFIVRQKEFSRAMRDVLDLSLQEGIIDLPQYNKLVASGEHYLPREVLDFIDPEVQVKNRAGRSITVRDSGMKNLSEDGTDKLVETDTEMLLRQTYERAYTRIFKNRANLEMLNLARTQPDNGIVTENPIIGQNKDGSPKFADVDATKAKISVLENGQRREMVMPLELAQEWVTGDPILSATMSNTIGWVSGTKLLKSMATTLNPEFAITNIPRDLAHIYLTTQEYSSVAPIAALQMANDLRSIVADAVKAKGLKNTELYKKYIDNGGGTEFLTYQGLSGFKGANKLSQAFRGLEDVMSSAGEFSEIVTRLALMKRAMNNKKTAFEATQIARNYLDFSQGGSVAKALDAGIPFFNAAIQASRGIARAAKVDPKVFGVKVMNIGAMAMSLYWANKFMYGDEIDDVPENEQKNNWIVMTPYTFKDSEGEERHYYIRIPKDQGQRVFASIAEGMAKKTLGEPVDGDQIAEAAKDFIPVAPTDMPPIVEAILGYSVNKDFWKREDIWRGPDVLPQEEYNKYTPETYVKFGEATGTSPMRMKYAIEQMFTRGNIWTSLVGYGTKQIFDEMTPEQRLEQTKELFERRPFVRRVLRSTRPDIKREKEIRDEKIRVETERLRANRGLDQLVEAEAVGRTDKREINDYIRRFPKQERIRLRRRRKNLRRFRGVKNRGFWFDLLDLPPESRAVNYWNRWSQLDEAGRRELDRQSRRVPGFRSKRFNRSFNKMRRLRR